MLREALKHIGCADLIGNGKRHLIPSWQPAGIGKAPEGAGANRPEGRRQTPWRYLPQPDYRADAQTLKILHPLVVRIDRGIVRLCCAAAERTPRTRRLCGDAGLRRVHQQSCALSPSGSLVSGLLAMMVPAFLEPWWVWAKAALGILMFKGVLTIVGAKADHAANLAQDIVAGTATRADIETALAYGGGRLDRARDLRGERGPRRLAPSPQTSQRHSFNKSTDAHATP